MPTTAKRVAGAQQVLLYDKGCKWRMAYPGHARKFTAEAVNRAKRWWCYRQAVTTEEVITNSQDGYIDAIEYQDLPGGGGYWSVAHYPDASQDIGLTDYTASVGEWEEIDDPDYSGTMLFQRESEASSGLLATSEITSNFQMPANPYILFNLWRAEPPKDADRLTYEPFTRISFGADAHELRLVIPYGGEPAYVQLWNAEESHWETLRAEGNAKLPTMDGVAKGQRVWISIRVLLGQLCVAFSREQGEGSGVMYKLPSREWRFVGVSAYYPDGWAWADRVPGVKAGPFRIEHNAGQVAFRWWPLYCPSGAQYLAYKGEVETTYPIWDSTPPGLVGGSMPAECRLRDYDIPAGTGATNCDTYHYPVWDCAGGVWSIVSDAPVVTAYNPGEDDGTTYSWYAALAAVQWDLTGSAPDANPSSVSGISHWQSPLLRGLQIRAEPYVAQVESDWPSSTDISAHVTGIVVAYGEGANAGQANINIELETGNLTLYENQMVEVKLGYYWSDGETRTNTVFIGYIATPGGAGEPSGVNCQMVAYDPTVRLRGEKAQGLEPDFQTFTPKSAVEWLAKRAGFHEDQLSLAGSDEPMYLGPVGPDGSPAGGGLDADNDAMMPAFGSELLASVAEFCRRDDESEWWVLPDATCKFILTKHDGHMGDDDGTLYEIKEDGAQATDPTDPELRCMALQRESTTMDSGDYADYVVIRGQDTDGNVIQQADGDLARCTDPTDAAWSGGWRHMYCETRDSTQTDGAATQRVDEVLTERSRLPVTVQVTTDVTTSLVKGERMHITCTADGGKAQELGVRSTVGVPKQFRVVGYEHHWDGRSTWPVTVITGRSIYETT